MVSPYVSHEKSPFSHGFSPNDSPIPSDSDEKTKGAFGEATPGGGVLRASPVLGESSPVAEVFRVKYDDLMAIQW